MLGDLIERALTTVGITKERVERFIGGPCGCDERREKLNRVSAWAIRVMMGKTRFAKDYIDRLLDDDEEPSRSTHQEP